MRALLGLAALLLAASSASAQAPFPPALVYLEDFENPGPGMEWTYRDRFFTSGDVPGRVLLGTFTNDYPSVDIGSVVNLPPHRNVTVFFDLYTLASMDGSPPPYGPDIITFSIDGTELMHASFSNFAGGVQSFPADYPHWEFAGGTGASEFGRDYGFPSDWPHASAMYRVERYLDHVSDDLVLSWSGLGLQHFTDEGWALDNVEVWVNLPRSAASLPVPELESVALVALGLAGVAVLALRRR